MSTDEKIVYEENTKIEFDEANIYVNLSNKDIISNYIEGQCIENDGQSIESKGFNPDLELDSNLGQSIDENPSNEDSVIRTSPKKEIENKKEGINGESENSIDISNTDRVKNTQAPSENEKTGTEERNEKLFDHLHKYRDKEDEVGAYTFNASLAITFSPIILTAQAELEAILNVTRVGKLLVTSATLLPIADDVSGGDISGSAFELIGIGAGGAITKLTSKYKNTTIDAIEETLEESQHLVLKSKSNSDDWLGLSIDRNTKLLKLKKEFASKFYKVGAEIDIDRNDVRLSFEEIGNLASNMRRELAVVIRKVPIKKNGEVIIENGEVKFLKKRILILGDLNEVNVVKGDRVVLHVHPTLTGISPSNLDKIAINKWISNFYNRTDRSKLEMIEYSKMVEFNEKCGFPKPDKPIPNTGQTFSVIINEHGDSSTFNIYGKSNKLRISQSKPN